MELCSEFVELARRLNQEKLFVTSEKRHLQSLHEQLQRTVERLSHVAWIARQQRVNLEGLVLSRLESTPSACCQRAGALETVTFVDAYRRLGAREAHYAEFVQRLRDSPALLASCLAAGERLGRTSDMHRLVHVVLDSVYGHGMLRDDERLILQVLECLLQTQLAGADDPRRLLRHGTCAFGRVYKVFAEGLHSAKLFLTGALHEPILQLLMEDELFLDIDPGKAAVRFPPRERLRRFGAEGSAQYLASLQRYRAWTVRKLVQLTERFVAGIRSNLYCFPSSLLGLVRQLYRVVRGASHVGPREAGAMCADLVFAFFVCPAIVNPEPYGICDAPIGYVARFNLMQVAHILQVLAMSKWEAPDPKLSDLYGQFDADCMSAVLDYIMLDCSGDEEAVPPPPPTPLSSSAVPCEPPVQELVRTAILITEGDLQALICFLKQVHECAEEGWVDKKALERVLAVLPPPPPVPSAGSCSPSASNQRHCGAGVPPTPPPTPSSKKSLLGKVGKGRGGGSGQLIPVGSGDASDSKMGGRHKSSVANDVGHEETQSGTVQLPEVEDVLVISLNVSVECPGMLAEHQVLSLQQQAAAAVLSSERQQRRQQRYPPDGRDGDGPPGDAAMLQQQQQQQQLEKRTRFSLSHEREDSIGNTSDNLEAVSEAASNHSVSSSIELENENDNLSDMISANVSGRGTPNVSGRDTPSSQVEGEGERERERERERRTLDLPVTAQKQNREDISDKFGKFEIRTLLEGDETISLVSDTWSTDVLASDSETVEQGERPPLDVDVVGHCPRGGGGSVRALSDMAGGPPGAVLGTIPPAVPPPASETASEAWSTDALASDSERLQDVDTDDTASLTRSDDAARFDDASSLRLDVTSTDESATPQASHSPVDGAQGAGAPPPARVWLNSLHAAGFRPIGDPPPPTLGGPGGEHGWAAVPPLAAPKVLRHPVSELVHDFNDFEIRVKDIRPKGPRASDSFKYAQGKVASILSTFDPLMEGTTSRHDAENVTEMDLLHADRELLAAPPSDDTPTDVVVMATQSLGRLSLSMDGLPERGLLPTLRAITPPPAPSDVEDTIETSDRPLLLGGVTDDVNSLAVSPSSPDVGGSLYPVAASSPVITNGDRPDGYFFALPRSGNGDGAGSSSSSSNGSGVCANGEAIILNGKQHRHNQQRRRQHQQQQSLMDGAVAPTASSGAIPKSISFDKSAEKGDKDSVDSDDKGKKSFFKNFKLTLKRPSRKGPRGHEDHRGANDLAKDDSSVDGRMEISSEEKRIEETGDDILAKYRTKTSSSPSHPLLNEARVDCEMEEEEAVTSVAVRHEFGAESSRPTTSEDNTTSAGLDNLYAFQDAKRKLRLVLSTVDARAAPWLEHAAAARHGDGDGRTSGNELVAFLRVQLAEAVNLQDRSLTAQLHETLRCVQGFDRTECKRLLESLKDDYKNRYPYIAYLIRCRQGLLFALSHLERLLKRVERDQAVCNRFMISVCVRFFLEQQERGIQKFMEEFQKLTASDEKTVIVEQFLQYLSKQMELDPIWQGANPGQIEQAHGVIERSIMSQIYILALYPNGDGDVHRDQVLHEHIQKLAKVVTPNHKDLRIPKMYHYECPWPSAQAEIITINAYKTPRDKLQCVVRCCTTIMNLLSMSNQKAVPAADDFVPVLVFVVLKANPGALLSTVQYVNSFYQKQLSGEDEYWWTQFCAAVEFIKTMDYVE